MALVSIIMPVHNGVEYLEQALDSIWQQDVRGVELIVVDDGSSDGTATMLASHAQALTILSQPNQGPPAARNAGLGSAVGRYIAFIDADDQWVNGRLQRQLKFLQSHGEVDLVQERIQHIALSGDEWIPKGDPVHAMSLSAALFKRELFDEVGLLDESMTYCDDVDWFMRAQQAGARVQRNDDVALLYRQHAVQLTKRKDLVEHYTLRALMKHRNARGG